MTAPMNDTALVLPPALADPPRRAAFVAEQLPDLLAQEFTPDVGAHTPELEAPYGPVVVWVGDSSLLNGELLQNPRAAAVCRSFGYEVPDVRGTAIITGGVLPDGWHQGLDPRMVDHIEEVCRRFAEEVDDVEELPQPGESL